MTFAYFRSRTLWIVLVLGPLLTVAGFMVWLQQSGYYYKSYVTTRAGSTTIVTLAIIPANTCVVAIVMHNTTAGALKVAVPHNAATPITGVLTPSVPAHSTVWWSGGSRYDCRVNK